MHDVFFAIDVNCGTYSFTREVRLHFAILSPRMCRLAGSWAASRSDQQQWIQVDLGDEMIVVSVTTKGRNRVAQWLTSFSLQYVHCTSKNVKPRHLVYIVEFQKVSGESHVFVHFKQ